MRRKFFSILTALALCLSLCPFTASAEDVPKGETLANNPSDTTITKVDGTVDSNRGVIKTVNKDGEVKINEPSRNAYSGLIELNHGTVGQNFGQINGNYGIISSNREKGEVRQNFKGGTIETNQGTVVNNEGHVGENVPAVMDGYVASVYNLAGGIVVSNSALVINRGTVKTNESGGVVYNYSTGKVETNKAGGTVYNFAAGASIGTNDGEIYWAVDDIVGTNPEKASFSAVTTENNRKFIQEGCTVTPEAGYYFSAPPAAENATVVFENGAYTIKNIKAAPVTLTVTTASIADAVALVRVNGGVETYYTDIQAAFDAAPDGSTVQLLNNVTLPEGTDLTVAKDKNLNLNCSDFTLSGSYGSVITVSGTLNFLGGTLKNTGDGNAVSVGPGGTFNMSAGTLEAENPYAAAVDTIGHSDNKPAKVNISGGSVGAGGVGLEIGAYTTVQLSGGTYGEIGAGSGGEYASEAQKAVTVPGLLAKGYAFFKDGQPVPLTEGQHTLKGPVTVAPCTHAGAEAADKRDGTHDITCHACGHSANEAHTWDDNYTCVCGAQAVAKIEKAGMDPSFVETAEQLAEAFIDGSNAGATFTLLNNVERADGLGIHINCILDLNGKTVHATTFPALSTYADTTVTIQGDGTVSSEKSHGLNVDGTTTLEGGTYISGAAERDGVYVNSAVASLSVTGEHVNIRNTGGGYGLAVNYAQSVQLSAGTYEGGTAAIEVFEGKTLADLLAEGCGIFKDNGTGVARTETTTGPGTFTVKKCDHAGAEVTPNGDGTHKVACPYCGHTADKEDCTYGEEYGYDTKNHWQTCTLCGGKKTAVHDAFTLTATPSGMVVTVKEGCATCGYGNTLGTVTINLPELVYGDLDGVVTASTTLTDWQSVGVGVDDFNTMDIILKGHELSPRIMGMLTNGNLLNAGEHKLAVTVIIDHDAQKLVKCNLTFTVNPISLTGKPTFGSVEGKTLREVEVTLPEGWSEIGTFAWADDPDAMVVQGKSYAYTFTPSDKNYAEFSDTVILWAKPSGGGGGGGGGIVTPPVDPDPGPDEPDPPGPDEPDPPVDPDEPLVPDGAATKLEVTEGIAQVPPALAALEHLNTPEKLTLAMRAAVTQAGIPARNTAVYDVKLMVSTDGGLTWTPATQANFPSAGLVVTLPYPEGTDSSYVFTVVHMFTTSAFGKTPGDTETPSVTNTEDGLRFTVTGLSPISVGWRAKEPDRPVEPDKPVTPSRPSGGGGGSGSSVSSWRVTVEPSEHGQVSSNRTRATEGGSVTLTVTPDSGYELDVLTVTDSRGDAVRLTNRGGGRYTFPMPDRAVTVTAVFKAVRTEWENPYSDVVTGAWYEEAVRFVTENGLMKGVGGGRFAPGDTLTRAQFAQILFNKEGRPAVDYLMRFEDVPAGAWYTEAVRWAASENIVSGAGGGRFAPGDPITREQLATILWRYAGSPASGGTLSFTDADQVSGYAAEALRWAVEQGIISGKGGGVLDPKGLATRAQAASMLRTFSDNGIK